MWTWYNNLPEWAHRLISVGITIIVALIIVRVVRRLIDRAIARRTGTHRRAETLGVLLKSVVTYVVALIAILQILQSGFGINVASLIAAAGVLGVAIGFGAQSMVKDIISGFFILFENQFDVGERVTIEGFTGTVQALGLRSTCLKGATGDLFFIPNGSISKVTNHAREQRSLTVTCQVSYETDVTRALEVLSTVAERAQQELDYLFDVPEVLGVVALGDSGVGLRTLCKCMPGDEFKLEREMLRRLKDGLEEHGIEIPYNKIVVLEPEQVQT